MLKDNIRHYMDEKSMTQAELSRASGISEPGIHKLLKGERTNPESRTLINLASALGVTAEDLMSNKPPPTSKAL